MTVAEFDAAADLNSPLLYAYAEIGGREFRLSWSGWKGHEHFKHYDWMKWVLDDFVCACWVAVETAAPHAAYLGYTTGVVAKGPTLAGFQIGPPLHGWPMATYSTSDDEKHELRVRALEALELAVENG